jgi:hypothetical protein
MATTDPDLSFENDVKPLFREGDREAMEFAFDLWSHDEVSENADEILTRVRDGSMPCDAPWPADRVLLFESWVSAGKPA